ncbi:filamentous hemagglutinin N-terminal domain-containing protein [Nodosilinea sp. P-1105]|uniref:two-partner secretion domain-containing protein n=1 Tax=Nodosilinea sp. P-1105 TaxID=2546229 RepID=UPI00146E1548|nr:filamentous hemagglutinin N-terminal domain-containing protein [Nodosilinea sp. P-1105]NMF82082.1 filamentous hemagglutinin N-terminal domain-containing protein [Nodosilinea sp. P-1105]
MTYHSQKRFLQSCLVALTCGGAALVVALPAIAQDSITSSHDGTGTQVSFDAMTQMYTINGGTQIDANLFHSFQRFGLNANEIANFLARPDISNILARVSGGEASIINGLLQVSGGDNANLFILNPAGVLLGRNARLDLAGSFSVSTASGLAFGDEILSATGSHDYSALTGNPTGYIFLGQEGVLLNEADLAVGSGQNITLAGSTVVSTGTLDAPGGNISITAVPDQGVLRISQEGLVMALAVPNDSLGQLTAGMTALDLPSLLAGAWGGAATRVQTLADGTVVLTANQSAIQTVPGAVTLAGGVNVSGTQAGQVQVLGQSVALQGAAIAANGTDGGGQVYIGGDYMGQGDLPTAQTTLVDSNSLITVNALETGNGGRVIVWADDYTSFAGQILARGGALAGDGGFAEVSARGVLNYTGQVDLRGGEGGKTGTLLLDPRNIRIVASGTESITFGGGTFTPNQNDSILQASTLENALASANVIVETGSEGDQDGDIFVDAPLTWGQNTLTLSAHRNIQINANLDASAGGGLVVEFGQGTPDGSGASYTVAPGTSVRIPLPTGTNVATSGFRWKQGSEGTSNDLVLNNGFISFAPRNQGAQMAPNQSSINQFGQLTQPFYYDNLTAGRDGFYKLTFGSHPLDIELGLGTEGERWNGNSDFINSQTNFVSQPGSFLEIAGYLPGVGAGPGGGPQGSGVVESSVNVLVGTESVNITNRYTLQPNDYFLRVDTTATALSSGVENLGLWVGTRDDYVGFVDGPTKIVGNFVNGSFVPITQVGEVGNVLRIDETTNDSGASVLFYSTNPEAQATHANCCTFTNATRLDPTTVQPSRRGDGSYAVYSNFGDLAEGTSGTLTWFYAAAPASIIEDVAQTVSEAAPSPVPQPPAPEPPAPEPPAPQPPEVQPPAPENTPEFPEWPLTRMPAFAAERVAGGLRFSIQPELAQELNLSTQEQDDSAADTEDNSSDFSGDDQDESADSQEASPESSMDEEDAGEDEEEQESCRVEGAMGADSEVCPDE